MINRCKECGAICPDFSEVCDCCWYIEEEEYNDGVEDENSINNS